MGGNNNFMSKKGWNPSNMANQVKVGEAEAAAIRIRKEEAKKEEEVRKERAQEAIKREQAIASGRPINTRVDWMYEGPSSGQSGTKEELEAVLLGKSRIDRFVKGNEVDSMKKDADVGVGALQTVNMARDIASKVREDPMLAIKRQEQAAYEKMMSDPRMRERLLQTIGGPKKEERSEKKHRHHHRRHRDERDDVGRDHKRRRTDSEDRNRRHRHSRRRSRSRTPERRRALSPGRDSRREEPERDSRRRRSYSKSRSPPRRRRSPSDSRSPPPRHRSRSPAPRKRSPSPRRESRSPPTRRRSPPSSPRRRSPSPRRRDDRATRGGHNNTNAGRYNDRPSYPPRQLAPPSISAEEQKAEMERKLAAMQADATELDLDREKRLAALAEREAADREAEMKQAMKAQKYGGKADFVNGLHKVAGERSLGDRIGGMKAGRRLEGGRED